MQFSFSSLTCPHCTQDSAPHLSIPVLSPSSWFLRRHGDEMERLPGGRYYRAHGRVDDTMNLGGIKVRVCVGVSENSSKLPPGAEGGRRSWRRVVERLLTMPGSWVASTAHPLNASLNL